MIVGPLPVRTRRGDVGRWSANWAPANRALVSDLVAPVGLVALVALWPWWLSTFVNICQLVSPLSLDGGEGSLVWGPTCQGVLGLGFSF